jgi:MIO-dependent L-tyrosine 2,3-aminomutase
MYRNNMILDGHSLKTSDVLKAAKKTETSISFSDVALKNIKKGRDLLEEKANSSHPIYGVNTGFGEMVCHIVNVEKETLLQENLIRSHAAGVGDWFSQEECRAIVLARINALSRGYSGIRQVVLDRLLWYINNNIIPAIPEQGSLGASGDLAPLSHIAVTMLAEGYLYTADGSKVAAKTVYDKEGLDKIEFKFKEGLALINGTSAMTGVSCLLVEKALQQMGCAERIAALACEVLETSSGAFAKPGHDIARPHKGQIHSAKMFREYLSDSKMIATHKELSSSLSGSLSTKNDVTSSNVFLQKAYTLRCIPQIHGAIYETIWHAQDVVNQELNSSNDNPLFFEGEEVFHGGNFHGQPIAFVMDFLAISMIQLGVISERRTERLLNKSLNGYKHDFLAFENPGLNSALAGIQYPATSIVAENRTYAIPASIQSIPSNENNQDIVSMGLVSTIKARRVLKNNDFILAVEAVSAAQFVDIKACYEKLSPQGKKTYDKIRTCVPFIKNDVYMSDYLYSVAQLIKNGEV